MFWGSSNLEATKGRKKVCLSEDATSGRP